MFKTLLLCLPLLAVPAAAQTDLAVDGREQPPAPETGTLKMGTGVSPDGHVIGINSRYLTLDGKPWLPVMGEFHYTRFPASYWEEQLLKMKAAGVSIVSTYVIWQHHEEKDGRFVWTGDRDLRRFAELCKKHGLYLFVRPGPWAHAEVRFGGIPDWVVATMPTRRDDPVYLAHVDRFYRQIAAQLKGLLWKDGGPVIGAQIENEYNLHGPGQGPQHIATLKQLLMAAGIDVPLYTVTGWDETIYPKGEVTPVFGGYPDEPWDRSAAKLPPKAVYAFQFDSRVSKGLGAQTVSSEVGDAETDMRHTPFLSAEFGGGVPTMYRRRPVIRPDDVAALLPVQLGSGVNLYGYYMFQGGRNPDGSPTRQENTAIGGYNDLPAIGYDFQAPLGEYGQAHPVLAKLRPFHYFLQSFGAELAPMPAHRPSIRPSSPSDLTTPRFSLRSLGDRGFLFVSNHVRQYPMAEQKQVRFRLALPSGDISFPTVDIPPDAYFIWPVNLDLDGATLRWATAQPLARLRDRITVLRAIDGIPVDLAFPAGTKVEGTATREADGMLLAEGVAPGLLKVNGATLAILSQAEAEKAWVIDGRLIETDAQVLADGELRSIGTPEVSYAVLAKDGFHGATLRTQAVTASVKLTKLRDALPVPPGTPEEPKPELFGSAAAWSIAAPPIDGCLRIDYQGDIARLFSGTRMIDDQFYDGEVWEIGLKRFAKDLKEPLILSILPLRHDAPIYFEDGMRPDGDQVAAVRSVSLVPEYRFKVRLP
jgi:beta-galactosidase